VIGMQLLTLFGAAGDGCTPKGGAFLGFPTWYKYLSGQQIPTGDATGAATVCSPRIAQLNDVWLIVAAVIEMMLRIAAIAAVLYVLYGGVQYIMSEGDPGKTAKARGTLINALVGLVIAIGAATIVSFLAGSFS
jgi:hypothetical protein